jgi:hypothetical protein
MSAVRASEVICPDVADDRITAKNGPNKDGKSNVVTSSGQHNSQHTARQTDSAGTVPLHSANSARSFENSAMSVLSAL